MPLSFIVEPDVSMIWIQGTGVLIDSELLNLQRSIREHPLFRPTFGELIDVRGVTSLNITPQVLVRIAENSIFDRESRIAILATADFAYGMARLFSTNFSDRTTVMAFRDGVEALAFLRITTPPPWERQSPVPDPKASTSLC